MQNDINTNNEDKQQILQENEEKFNSLCQVLSDCIILHDLNGDILESNITAQNLFGYKEVEFLKLNFSDIQPQNKRQSDNSLLAESVFNDSNIDISKSVFIKKDGSRFPAEIKTSYIRFKVNNNPLTVTQRIIREINNNLSKSNHSSHKNELTPNPKQREDFLQLINRELKIPLNEMLSSIKLLGKTKVDEEQSSLLSLTLQSGSYLVNAINIIMDLFKIGNNKFQLQNHPFDLISLVDDVIEIITTEANSKGIEVTSYFDPSVSTAVIGDESRIQYILLTLMSNSLKLTTTGEIKLSIQKTDEHEVLFIVTDTGKGIAEEEQRHLFSDNLLDSFSVSREYANVALEYALVRQLIILMQGKMEFNCHPENGSDFYFSINLQPSDTSINTARYKFLSNKTVIYIDFDESSRNEVKNQIESWGADIHTFDNAEQSIKLINSFQEDVNKPSLIVLNIHQSDANYAALVRTVNEFLRKDDNDKICDFVVISPGELSPTAARHFARIKHTHIKHPLRLSTFANKLARLLCLYEPFDSEPSRSAPPPPEQTRIYGKVLIVDDAQVTQLTVGKLLTKYGFIVDCASNGVEAVNAVEKNHFDIILMDVQMPEMDGIEATKRIRQLEQHKKHIPILAVTANMKEDIWRNCVYAGMDDFMTKPIDTQIMVATIKYWLGIDDSQNTSTSQINNEKKLNNSARKIPSIITGNIVGDIVKADIIEQMEQDTGVDTTTELVKIYLTETENRIKLINEAMVNCNFNSIMSEAQRLSSSSATFGANWLQQLSNTLIDNAKTNNTAKCNEILIALPEIFTKSSDQLMTLIHLSEN